ncbi:HAD hydrolase family protein [Mycoplasmopsis cynos]|uniref:HAD hydrolase family protein n=1 Tax=Mycoplasmopsis cynos TaxID=171284 RepID=UPI0024C97941|nr:HAD hydrolase family protein [Mycoplasmopsis cynos]WAM03026.1 HAD hydrolase family protein [Mycoplasmopsis cynos]
MKSSEKKKVTEYTKSVINRLQSQIPVVVSTGRGVNDKTLNIVRKLGSETYIAWNGAQTVENGVVVKKHIIDKDISQELFNEIKKNKCFVVYNSNVKYYAFVKNWFYKLLMGFGKKSPENIMNIKMILMFIKFFNLKFIKNKNQKACWEMRKNVWRQVRSFIKWIK